MISALDCIGDASAEDSIERDGLDETVPEVVSEPLLERRRDRRVERMGGGGAIPARRASRVTSSSTSRTGSTGSGSGVLFTLFFLLSGGEFVGASADSTLSESSDL